MALILSEVVLHFLRACDHMSEVLHFLRACDHMSEEVLHFLRACDHMPVAKQTMH